MCWNGQIFEGLGFGSGEDTARNDAEVLFEELEKGQRGIVELLSEVEGP